MGRTVIHGASSYYMTQFRIPEAWWALVIARSLSSNVHRAVFGCWVDLPCGTGAFYISCLSLTLAGPGACSSCHCSKQCQHQPRCSQGNRIHMGFVDIYSSPPYTTKAWELLRTYVVHMAELLHRELASHFHSTVWLLSLEVRLLCQEQSKFHMALPVLDRQDNGPCALCMFLSTFIWRVCEDIKSLVSILRAWWSGKCSAVIDIYYLNWLVIV